MIYHRCRTSKVSLLGKSSQTSPCEWKLCFVICLSARQSLTRITHVEFAINRVICTKTAKYCLIILKSLQYSMYTWHTDKVKAKTLNQITKHIKGVLRIIYSVDYIRNVTCFAAVKNCDSLLSITKLEPTKMANFSAARRIYNLRV